MSSHRPTRRAAALAGTLIALTVLLVSATTASAQTSCAALAGTPLAPSNFVASDGDQCSEPILSGNKDWQDIAGQFALYAPDPFNPPPAPNSQGLAIQDDDTQPFSTFSGGEKEFDTSKWDFVPSNANGKVNALATWAFPENIGGSLFTYLGFFREGPNNVGNASANIDFELNQADAADPASYIINDFGEPVIKRQGDGTGPGTDDVLIIYDWNGNQNVTVTRYLWEEGPDDPATLDVDEGNLTGDWVDPVELITAGFAQAAVNDGFPITNFLLGGPTPLGTAEMITRTFGEASVNLSQALGIAQGECVAFGSYWLRTRESGSLNANLVDLTQPAPVGINNCGEIVVKKETDPDDPKTPKTGFPFTSSGIPVPPATASKGTVTAWTLTDDESQTLQRVEPNTAGAAYDVSEGALPADYVFDRVECVSNTSNGQDGKDDLTTYTGTTAHVKVAAGERITCTYHNTEKGSVAIKKVTNPSPDPTNPDTAFTFQAPAGLTDETLTNGQTSTPQAVVPGSYVFTEDTEPGWAGQSVTCDDANSSGTTSNQPAGTSATVTFDVQPGEDVVCTVTNRLKPAGINIVKTGPAFAYHGDQVTFTYTVTNPAEQPIHDVVVTDDKCSPVTLQGKAEGGNDTGAAFLDPGDVWTYTCTMTMGPHADGEQDPHVNVATVAGKDERDNTVSDTDDHLVDLLHPGIDIEKTGPAEANAGDNVKYTMVVTNTGDTAIPQATLNLSDPRCDASAPVRTSVNGDASPTVLDPKDAWTYECSARTAVGQARVDNTATVCALDVNGRQVCDTDTASTVLRAPAQFIAPQRVVPGSARLIAPARCVTGPFTIRVTGRQIASATLFVGNRRVRTITAAQSRARRGRAAQTTRNFDFRIDPRTVSSGVQRVSVRVVFNAASGTRTRTLRATFQRCARRVVRPRFTG